MVFLSTFVTYPDNRKPARVHLVTPHVPPFWKGFYAIFAPTDKNKCWTKRWFKSRKGKTIRKAHAVISVEAAHKINWLKYIG